MRYSIVVFIICLVIVILWSVQGALRGAQAASGAADFADRLPGLHSPMLDELANRPGRPPWAPLDVLWGHCEVVPQLLEVLSAPSAADRARAAFVLGQLGCAEAAEALRKVTQDNDRTVRLHAGIALAYMGDERGLPAARAALTGAPPWVRFYAIMGRWRMRKLGEFAIPSVIPPIIQPPFLAKVMQAAVRTPASMPVLATSSPPSQEPSVALDSGGIWEAVADAFAVEADWWWHKGDYDQAIRCLQVTVFLQPDLADTYGDIAWLQWSLGYNTAAIGTYHRGIAANPNNPEAYFNLGLHYFNTRRYDAALPYLKEAMAHGGSQIMRRTYAHALEKLGQIEASLREWEKMFQETPDQPAVRQNYQRLRELAAEQPKQ